MGQAESKCQTAITKWIDSINGHWVNGVYSKSGEGDLQAGIPYKGLLVYIAIEVKDKDNYFRVISALKEVQGKFIIVNEKKLKPHEFAQVAKINGLRQKGGLALFAYHPNQVKEYINGKLHRV